MSYKQTPSNKPFTVLVPESQKMPNLLYVFESRETGEFEPDLDGEPLPILEMDLHQYANMQKLKSGLDEATYDKVRKCLGLEPLALAAEKGSKITESIRKNLDNSQSE